MYRIGHIVCLALQGALWLGFLHSFPLLMSEWEDALADMLPGKPLPALSEKFLGIANFRHAIDFEWPYLTNMVVATFFFGGVWVVCASENRVVAIQRSFVYQVIFAVLLGFLLFCVYHAVLLPHVKFQMDGIPTAEVVLRGKIWGGGMIAYLCLMGGVSVWLLVRSVHRSEGSD